VTAAVGLSLANGETLAGAQRAALTVFAIRIGGAALAYGTQVLLARFMGQAEYGVFALAWVWIAILGHGCLLGVAQSVCRFVPHYRARGDLDLARGFLRGGALHALTSGAVTAALGAAVVSAAYAIQFRPESFLVLPVVGVLVWPRLRGELRRPRGWW